MGDRYLLESGAPDGYLLEDGSGVLLLDPQAGLDVPAENGIRGPTFPRAGRSYAPSRLGSALVLLASIVTVAAPFSQGDWPVPRSAKPVVQSWQASFPLPLTTHRPPSINRDWPNPRGYAPLNRGWTDSFKLPLQAGASVPFAQDEWRIPRAPRRFVKTFDDTQWSFTLPLQAGVAEPFAQIDWPNPRGPRPRQYWTDSFKLTLQTIEPFSQYDWPNPRSAKPVVADWQQGTPYTLTVVTGVPFAQTDWPNPLGPIPLNRGFTVSFRLPPTVPAPNQYNWPNPRGYDRSVDLRTWLQTGYLEEVGNPFRQRDWPVPQSPRRLSGLSWSDSFKLPLTRPTAGNQKDWPNPRGYQRSIELLTWSRPALQIVPQQGHNQYDWPVPKGWGPRQDWIKGTPASNLGSIKPFKQLDWPLPGRPRRNPDLYKHSPTALTAAFQKAFSQLDWPVPKGVRRTDDLSFSRRGFLQRTEISPLQPIAGQKIFFTYRGMLTTGPNIALVLTPPPVPPQPPISHKPPKTHHGAAQSGAGLTFARSGTAQTGVTSGKSRADVRGKNEQAEAASGTSKSDAQDP